MKNEKYFLRINRPAEEFSIITLELFATAYIKQGMRDLKFSPDYLFLKKNNRIKLFSKEKDLLKFTKKTLLLMKNNPDLFNKRLNEVLETYNKVVSFFEKTKSKPIVSERVLKKCFQEFVSIVENTQEPLFAGYHFLPYLEKKYKKHDLNFYKINKKIDSEKIFKTRKKCEDYWVRVNEIVLFFVREFFKLRKKELEYETCISLKEFNTFINTNNLQFFPTKKEKYAFINNADKLFEGREVENIIKEKNLGCFNMLKKNPEKIEGTIANKGFAKGYVINVSSVKDLEKIRSKPEKTLILVTIMTSPKLIPFIKNFKAIVTDEGGLLNHATIVSREFGIPCITGTKVATKILKNNFFVEVNANKGFVKILKKN